MIEFKRAGDVMVFTCPGFKIEVAPNGAERIEFNRETIKSPSDFLENITDAFKVLDMMIEHKARQGCIYKIAEPEITFDVKRSKPGNIVNEMHIKVNVDTKDAEDAIRKLNEYVWKHAPSENMPGHRFREFMKKEGL